MGQESRRKSFVFSEACFGEKNTLFAKVSAATLNGYAAVADTIAESKNVKLESSIGNAGKVSSTIWRVVMYTLVILGLLAYTYAILKKRK